MLPVTVVILSPAMLSCMSALINSFVAFSLLGACVAMSLVDSCETENSMALALAGTVSNNSDTINVRYRELQNLYEQ